MNALETIKKYGQEQLLRFESELTDEQKKKLEAARTPEELLAIAKEG